MEDTELARTQMSQLHWTTDLPTEPGWYWLRYRSATEGARVTDVELIDIRHGEPFFVSYAGSLRRVYFHRNCEPVEWAGPIPEPEDKKC